MRTVIGFVLAVFLSTGPLLAQSDFRGFEWGTSKSKIIEEEGQPIRTLQRGSLDLLAYSVMVDYREFGYSNAMCLYMLTPKGHLGAGSYLFMPNHEDDVGAYYTDFQDFADRLKEEYGPPDSTSMDWQDDRFQDQPGRAIAHGDLTPRQEWENEDAIIVHYMSTKKQFQVDHFLQYFSKQHLDEIGKKLP